MYEAPFWKFEPQPLPSFPTTHKHLNLWSNHYVKNAEWWLVINYVISFYKL